MENYRKAKKGEVRCEECKYSQVREDGFTFSGKKRKNRILECAYTISSIYYQVGKNKTCDDARQKKERS